MTRIIPLLAAILTICVATPALADDAQARESIDDAWWTGPILSLPAITIPAGSFVTGAALWDQRSEAATDPTGAGREPDQNDFGFLPFLVYGVNDDLELGLFPSLGWDQVAQSKSSSHLELGDWAIEGQYKLHDFQEGQWLPTISLNLAETFPTGRYDQLSRFSDGIGAGAYATTLGLYTQSWFWMPTGRILRAEFNLSYTVSSQADIRGMSVYGTDAGFSGHANPGSSLLGDLTLEYSLSRRWAIATEFQLEQDDPTHISGRDASGAPLQTSSGLGGVFYVTPYLEYGWSAEEGLSVGAQIFAAGHNEAPSVTPMILFTRYFAPNT